MPKETYWVLKIEDGYHADNDDMFTKFLSEAELFDDFNVCRYTQDLFGGEIVEIEI